MLTVFSSLNPAWDSAVQMLPLRLRDVFLTSAWGRVCEREGAKAYLAVYEDHRFFTMQPFVVRPIPGTTQHDVTLDGYGGPVSTSPLLARTDGAGLRRELDAWMHEHGIVSEFCLLNPVTADHQSVLLAGVDQQVLERGVTILPISDDSEFLRGLRPNRAESLRKGADAVVDWCQPAEVADLYWPAMDRKGAEERWRFTLGDLEHLKKMLGENCCMLSAKQGNSTKAVAVFLFGTDVAYYYLSAVTEQPVTGYADQLILAGMKLAQERGCRWLHLGGGRSNDDGLAAYKRSWGGMIRPVYSLRRIYDLPQYLKLTGDAKTSFFPAYRAE